MTTSTATVPSARPETVPANTPPLRSSFGSNPRPRTIVAFLLPFAIPFLVFYIAPVCYAIWQSLHVTERTGGKFGTTTTRLGGFEQYQAVLGDHEFWASVGRMALFGIVQVPLMLFMALLIALLLDSTLVRFKGLFRVSAFLPYAIPSVIAAIMWSFLYHPQISPIVSLLRHLGIDANFLSPSAILWSIANISTWLWTGYNMLIIFSALQSIPQEIYEAAKIDGARQATIAIRIKVPIVVPAIIMTAVFSIIGTLQLYSEPTVLKQMTSSISNTYSPNMMAYLLASGDNYQRSAAMSVIIAVVTFVLSFGFMKLTARRAEL